MRKKGRSILWFAALGITGLIAVSPTMSIGEEETSSACIACHTDLDEMDSYGAQAAKSGAGIAG